MSGLNIFRILWLITLLALVAFTNMVHAAPAGPAGRGGRAVGVQAGTAGAKRGAGHCGAASRYNEFSYRK